jgi:hypothetical protein
MGMCLIRRRPGKLGREGESGIGRGIEIEIGIGRGIIGGEVRGGRIYYYSVRMYSVCIIWCWVSISGVQIDYLLM